VLKNNKNLEVLNNFFFIGRLKLESFGINKKFESQALCCKFFGNIFFK